MAEQAESPRSWWVPTRDKLERVLVLGFLVLRTTSLVQAVIGVTMRSMTTGQRSPWTLACLGAVAVESVVVGVWLYRRGNVTVDRWPLTVDIGVATMALETVAAHTSAADRMSAWGMGVHQVSLSTAILIGLVIRRFRIALLSSAALAGFFFVVVTRDVWGQWTRIAAAATDAGTYLGFLCMAWAFARLTRDLADQADQARRRVAELERQRARATVHDLLPYLRQELFTQADERTRTLKARQAKAKYRQMRAFVDGSDHPDDVGTGLRTILDLHPLLSTRAVFDLDSRIHLTPEVHERLLRAVDTALANVEQNAPDATVVVSAVSSSETVTVCIHDDGPGFDPEGVKSGYGIANILGQHLEEIRGRASVESRPGKGTEVTIVVPKKGL